MHKHHDSWNEREFDSGATNWLFRENTGLHDHVTANPGTTVKMDNEAHEEMRGNGRLDLLVETTGRIVKNMSRV